MLQFEHAAATDAGKLRGNNEDALGFRLPENADGAALFVLADGVGGQAAGELASRWTVDTLLQGFAAAAASPPAPESISGLLRRLIQTANQCLHDASLRGEQGGAMASTVVACALCRDRALFAHVGDSRAYLLRAGELRQITADHTLAAEQVKLGLLSAGEAAASPARGCLSRSLGNDLIVQADLRHLRLEPGDLLLLSTDGLHGALDERQLARALRSPLPLAGLAARLVRLACDADGSDNISVLLIRILEVERLGMYRGRPYRLPGP